MSKLFSLLLRLGGWVGGWLVGWLENWRVILITAFNYVIVEVVAEMGKKEREILSVLNQC